MEGVGEDAKKVEKTILVVDDDQTIRETLQMILEMEGYRVLTASNGQEALDLLKSGVKPSLILLDLMMEIMNGWEFLEISSHDDALSSIPIAVITAAGERMKPVGAKQVIKKPVDIDHLLGVVRRLAA